MIIKNEIILKSQQRFISETLSSNNDKILQTFDRITWFNCWKSMQNRVARTSKCIMINFDNYTNENK